MHLKRLIYERTQRKHETLRNFSRALLDLVNRLDETGDKDSMLCEVFCNNINDKNLRVELKKKLRETPDIKFIKLREYALQISEEEEDCCSGAGAVKTEVMNVQQSGGETHSSVDTSGEGSAINQLQAQVATMANLQHQMMEILGSLTSSVMPSPQLAQSPHMGSSSHCAPTSVGTQSKFTGNGYHNTYGYSRYNRRPPLSSIQCHLCRKYGHYKRDCPQRGNSYQPNSTGFRGPQGGSQSGRVPGNSSNQGNYQMSGDKPLMGNM